MKGRHYSHLNSTVQVLQQYKGEQPFSLFIKNFFSAHKKYGSKDRKQIAHLAYTWFRTCNITQILPIEDGIVVSQFLCSQQSTEFISSLKPEWDDKLALPFEEKLELLGLNASAKDLFPLNSFLSDEIDQAAFGISHLTQPDLFIRIRPGFEWVVKKKLQEAGITFHEIDATSIALPNNSAIDSIVEIDKEAVIQDLSSQRVAEFLKMIPTENIKTVWDCCAASGGKSILAYDTIPPFKLVVSDIRENILHNLQKRFDKAGITNYDGFVNDLSLPNKSIPLKDADLIICDAPCSGSGTWGRTPEQLKFFKGEKIHYYSSLQKRIVMNAIPHLQNAGFFLYITCSVFKEENENILEFILSNSQLELENAGIIEGYDKAADTMFAALFRKKSV